MKNDIVLTVWYIAAALLWPDLPWRQIVGYYLILLLLRAGVGSLQTRLFKLDMIGRVKTKYPGTLAATTLILLSLLVVSAALPMLMMWRP